MSREAEYLAWQRSRVGKTDLLMLVTIGNRADENGRDAWCEVPYLMQRCRLSERGALYTLQRLVKQGEIEIEYNTEGRDITLKGGRRFRPKWFIHVLCVCEWERYQTGWKPVKVANFKRGRTQRKPAKTADSQSVDNPQLPAKKSATSVQKTAKSGDTYKEGSFSDLVLDLEQGAAPPISTQNQNPDENLSVITKLAHLSIDVLGQHSLSDLKADVVQRCIDEQIAWSPDVVRKAIDSALWQRKNRRRA